MQVEFEEKWWEASDWAGMREMGAEKSGCRLDGSAWRETWRESLTNARDGSPTVERSAHKWAQDSQVCLVLLKHVYRISVLPVGIPMALKCCVKPKVTISTCIPS